MEANIVDRCESCHVGIREPVRLTRAAMNGGDQNDEWSAAFTSHPNPELLAQHNPEQFGCTTCHGGNGRATTSAQKGHGRYKHWLWPMYYRENFQAGCNQCHTNDVVLQNADVLNQGKKLFMERGCIGCHRHESFDRDADALFKATQGVKDMERERDQTMKRMREAEAAAGNAESDAEARRLLDRAASLKQVAAQIDGKIQQLNTQTRFILRDVKKVGPNLKEIRLKMRREFIPAWLKDPQAFRPGTKMPTFRLDEEERKAIAAFIWQAALDGPALPAQTPGDINRGKQLFETRGCLSCHSSGQGGQRVGGDFAANLSRIGDKNNYDYVVRWVHNPRQRSAPYCLKEQRDLTPADYAKHNLPFVFDDAHSRCPNDGSELQIQNMTVMPNFRLSEQESRDIASYLMSLRDNVSYPDASFMEDKSLFERGKALTRQYGCAGCHEIRGMESEQRIGTELTVEGSKPIERLDFGLLAHKAKDGLLPDGRPNLRAGEQTKWYDVKGFFEQKLTNPAIFDLGKERTAAERLRMPNIYFKDRSEIDAITTFLLGSVETSIPAYLKYNPQDERRYIQEGWWVIKKYNCMGCHNVAIGQASTLMGLPMYQGEQQDRLPPRLVTEGARVNPDWLLKFLEDPALSATNQNRNGVREYLEVRMPTFNFSPNELQTLVRFFMAYSAQPMPYVAEQLEPLTPAEQDMARALFTSPAAPCLKCHMTGNPEHDKNATAPNFLLAQERLRPSWTQRWILDPRLIDPTTAMPQGLFRPDQAHGRWVFNAPTPDSFNNYTKDHAELLVRYMFQITPAEQARLGVRGGSTGTGEQKAVTTSRNKRKGKRTDRAALTRRAGVSASR